MRNNGQRKRETHAAQQRDYDELHYRDHNLACVGNNAAAYSSATD